MWLILTSDDRCSQIQEVGNAVANTVIAKFGTKVTFNCLIGHEFSENMTSDSVQCADGTWNRTQPDCQGNNTIIYKIVDV